MDFSSEKFFIPKYVNIGTQWENLQLFIEKLTPDSAHNVKNLWKETFVFLLHILFFCKIYLSCL